MILTWLIAIPTIGGILAFIAGRFSAVAARWIALLACAVDLVIAISLLVSCPVVGILGSTIVEQQVSWIPQLGISYHLALDGLSLLMVMLTAVLGMAAVASSWHDINERVGGFYFVLMLLLSGILGVFMSYDLILFYLFWELMLIPMYLVIGIWGHERRVFAAVKFFLFTFVGGLFMLAAILGLYAAHGRATGVYTFDYQALLSTAMTARYALWLMLGLFIGFTVKLPMVPLHTWLADAHTEAPTAGSVILAGLLLKTGAYGLIRFTIPLFHGPSSQIAQIAMILGTAGIIYGALLAYPQSDLKRLVAYTSVSHMGFVLLGIYAGTTLALQGAVVEIIAHGITTGALFILVGMIKERTGTRDLNDLGGLWATVPKIGGFTLIFALAALGLPGFGSFIGEFLVLIGVFQVSPVIASVASFGFVLSAIYATKLLRGAVLGPNEKNWSLTDISLRETIVLGLLGIMIIWLGICPQPVFNTAQAALRTVSQALGEVR